MNIAALISGGVDSAVAVHLLCEQGYKPDLFYIKIGMDGDEDLTCTAEEDIELCTATARRYGLKLNIIDLHRQYWDNVVAYAIDKVKRGLTPNPDVMCNKLIKFGCFEQEAGHLYDKTATGHYAGILEKDGKIFLNSVIKNGESEMKYGASLDVSSISIQCEVTTQLEQNLAVTSSVKLEKSNNVDMKNWSAVRVEEEKENLDQVYWEMDPLYRESSMKKAEIFIADGISLTQILETLMQLAQYI